jgi:hypothetical protein
MTTRLKTALLVATAAYAVVAVTHSVRAAPSPASNKRAATLDARRLLERLKLPPGAGASSTEPAGDGGRLKPMTALNLTGARVEDHRWWLIGASPGAVLAYIESHRPVGSKLDGTGALYDHNGLIDRSLEFVWPPVPHVLGDRELSVTLMALPDGRTGLLAQAQSNWIVPRPASETLPSAVREIDVSTARLDRPATLALAVTSAATVHDIVAMLDALPIVQPAVYSCPALIGQGARVITFDFRADAGGPRLARATYVAYPGLAYESGPCNPISLMIGGRREKPLLGGDFLGRVERLLGVELLR